MSFALQHDIASWLAGENALDAAVITAAAGNDGVAVAGNIIDRLGSGKALGFSAVLLIAYKAVLAATKTLTITALVKGSADSGMASPTTLATYSATVVATGQTGGSTERGVVALAVDLGSGQEYLQATVTGDLNATGTDTVALAAILVRGGAEVLPAT